MIKYFVLIILVLVIAVGGFYAVLHKHNLPTQLSLAKNNPVSNSNQEVQSIPTQKVTTQNVQSTLDQTNAVINTDISQMNTDIKSIDQVTAQSGK